jgi:fibronectin type 3 domain-containing protein
MQSAAAQAVNLKFVLLNDALITRPHFEDRQLTTGKAYEYAIASVDVFGVESTYSPFARIQIDITTRIVETCTIRKISTGVELTWDTSLLTGADAIVIYRKRAGDLSYQKVVSLPARQTSYVDRTAAKGSLYIYIISAERGKDVLAKSEEKNIHY